MTGSSQLTLSQLEHVFEAVNDLEAASTGELAHVSSVEEALRVYTHTHTHLHTYTLSLKHLHLHMMFLGMFGGQSLNIFEIAYEWKCI